MPIVRAYKYKLKPSKSVIAKFEQWLSICRELYNAGLQERRDAWQFERKSISFYEQSKQLPQIKEIREDVLEVQSQVLQNILRRLDRTFQAFFRRIKKGEKAGYPRFKGINKFDSFTYPQMKGTFRLEGNKLYLGKIGSVKVRLHREITGNIKTCTIKQEVSGWFAIFTVEVENEILQKTNQCIGVDVGIENFLTLSDGRQIKNFKYYESTQKKLRVAQRRVSRRRKNSSGRRKAVIQLRKIHQKIKDQRKDYGHKVSTWLIQNYDLIAIENLNILGMSKGFLSKQILDVAWSSFFQKLLYKAESADRKVIKVNPNGTSQTCVCGELNRKKLSTRWHHCLACGYSVHRDVNSAQVILKLGLGSSLKDKTYRVADSVSLKTVS